MASLPDALSVKTFDTSIPSNCLAEFAILVLNGYQYKREPLTPDEANRLTNSCSSHEEKLIIWTVLDTGLRVAELAKLTKDNLDWQNHRIDDLWQGQAVALYLFICPDRRPDSLNKRPADAAMPSLYLL